VNEGQDSEIGVSISTPWRLLLLAIISNIAWEHQELVLDKVLYASARSHTNHHHGTTPTSPYRRDKNYL
jgi:hypothetical protein